MAGTSGVRISRRTGRGRRHAVWKKIAHFVTPDPEGERGIETLRGLTATLDKLFREDREKHTGRT